jgi:roadblock/LC7 domain-containing protein
MHKFKKLFVSAMSLALCLSFFSSSAKTDMTKDVVNDCYDLIELADQMFEENYNHGQELFDISDRNALYRQNATSTAETNQSQEYWTVCIKGLYEDLSEEAKQQVDVLKNNDTDFGIAYSVLTGSLTDKSSDELTTVLSDNEDNSIGGFHDSSLLDTIKSRISTNIKKMVGAGTATLAFSTIYSMVTGINGASFIPFVGWAIAGVLVTALIIVVVINWSYIQAEFHSFFERLKSSFGRISNLLSRTENEASDKAKSNPDVADDATDASKMQREVEKGHAPRDVRRVDSADSKHHVKPHVHFKDGTALNNDGTVHDNIDGRPDPSREVWDWLHQNGWCMNGIK